MLCQEYMRLRQQFESALRHYGRVLLSPRDNELVGTAARQAAEIRKKALEERDAAKQRLRLHEQGCPTCTHNRHNPHLLE